ELVVSDSITLATNLVLTTGHDHSLTFSGSSASLNVGSKDLTIDLNAAGLGGVVSGNAATDVIADDLDITTGSAGIGGNANPLTMNVTTLTTDTSGLNGPQFLSE